MKMNKFKYYIEMAQGKLKQKNLETIEINAIINNNQEPWELYKNKEFLELEGDNGNKFNQLLKELVNKLSEIKNNIAEDNPKNINKIEKFKSKLEMYMKKFINEFVILYNYAAENGNKKEEPVETLKIIALVPINIGKAIITIDHLNNFEITIEKK